jgi:ABC-type transport system involved in cytochrome c biogenesis permease subunit
MNALPIVAFVALALAALTQIAFMVAGKGKDPVSRWLALAAAACLFAYFVARSVEIQFPALTSVFESLVFFSACVSALAFAYALQRKIPYLAPAQLGLMVLALALLAIASSPIAPKEALSPIPALRSFWLALHVSLAFLGESLFALGFVASLAYLFSKKEDRRASYDRLAYAGIAAGYPLFTAGALVFGAIWAQRAWGVWWSWDPKETWALVTWLAYTLYLHQRLIAKRRDRWTAIVSVIAFVSTLFTFFGVNFLLSGLHSYG